MAQKVMKVGVRKANGYLYFVDKQGDVSRAPMARGGVKKGRPEKVGRPASRRRRATCILLTSRVTSPAPRWPAADKTLFSLFFSSFSQSLYS